MREGNLVEPLARRRGILARQAGLAELRRLESDRSRYRLHGQIPQRVGPQPCGHLRLSLLGEHAPAEKLRGKELVDRGHVDAVEAGCDDRRTGDPNMDLPSQPQRPHPAQQHLHGRAAHDRVLDEDHPLALEHFAERRVFRFGLLPTARGAVDKRAAGITIADQTFHRWDREPVGHGVGRRLARVGNGHDDGVGVDGDRLQAGELFAELLPRQIHAAVVHRACVVGEVDPFEEAMGLLRAVGEPFDAHALAVDDERRPRLERPDRLSRKAEVEQGDALAGRSDERAELGVFHRPDAERIAGHDHPATGVEHGDVPGTIKPL